MECLGRDVNRMVCGVMRMGSGVGLDWDRRWGAMEIGVVLIWS